MSGTNNPLIVKNRVQPGFLTYLLLKGWKIEDYHIAYTQGDYQVCMEFCIGDFCVGVYHKSETGMWDLIEQKERIEDFTYAFLRATDLKRQVEQGEIVAPRPKSLLD